MKYIDYKEAKKHGSENFPLQYYYVDRDHLQYVMPLHWHGETEIVRVLEGELTLWLNTAKYELSENDVIFIESGTLHRAEPKECRYECLVFDPGFVSGQINSPLSELIAPFCSGSIGLSPRCPAAEETAKSLMACAREREAYHELKLASLVCELIRCFYVEGYVLQKQLQSKSLGHRRAVITLLLKKIDDNYSEKITLTELADWAGMNEKYLCRFFREFTGYTPTEYINRTRVEHACHEMKFNHRNVTEAAYECGFNEISYFSKCFKRYKGMAPGAYVKSFCKN